MTKASISIFAALAIITAPSPIDAQIVWGTATQITSDSDVNTTGTAVDALQALPSGNFGYTKPPEMVNGTLFNSDSGALTDGVITYSGPLGGGTDGGQGISGISSAFQSVLQGCVYVDDNPADYNGGTLPSPEPTGVITLDVIQGDTYQVQVFNAYPVNFRPTYLTSGGSTVELTGGDFAIGQFTATSSSEVIDFYGTTTGTGSGIGEVNAVDLRLVPEPSTWAMFLASGGLALLGYRFGRKSLRA